MTIDETNDIHTERDCRTCVWHSEDGCHVWNCNYLSYTRLSRYIKEHPEMMAANGEK